jgi:hypothetical protein
MHRHAKQSAIRVAVGHKNKLARTLLFGALSLMMALPAASSYAANRQTFDTQIEVESRILDVTRVRLDALDVLQGSAKVANAKLSAIQLISASKGTAIADGKLVFTSDAGATWRDVSPKLGQAVATQISAQQFLDGQRGFAVDRNWGEPMLWRTANGGAQWQPLALPFAQFGQADVGAINMHFTDAKSGWVIAREPSSSNFSFARLYTTQDGGDTWSELARPPVSGQLKFASKTRGWLLGGADGRALYQTIDGGKSWQAIARQNSLFPDAQFTDLAMPININGRFTFTALATFEQNNFTEQKLSHIALNADGSMQELSSARVIMHATATNHARLLSADASIILSGNVAALQTIGDKADFGISVFIEPSGTANAVSEANGARWMLFTDGTCSATSGKQFCEAAQQLASLKNTSAREVSASSIAPPRTLEGVPVGQLNLAQSTRRGFDACQAQSTSTLQTWWTSSPFKDVNFYMGGRNRACSQPNLNATWISSALNIGWNLMPTWVGYQSPSSICTGCAKFSTTAATARTQGIAEADLAADAAEALGISKPNVIYFNLEKYNTETQSEKSFIDGFSAQTRVRGYVPAMYVHWTNVASFTALTNAPEGIWVARWSGSGGSGPSSVPNPNTITGVSDSIFVNKRIWQHYGDFTQTWGGVTIAIDANVANGIVVGAAPVAQTITFTAPADRTLASGAFTVSATASSGLPVTFISLAATVCTVSGTNVTLLTGGTCTLRASQAGNSSYLAAATVDRSFNISNALTAQSITFAALSGRTISSGAFDVSATASSGLTVSFISLTPATCTVSGVRTTLLAVGTCTLRAAQAGNSTYAAAANVDQSFAIAAAPALTWPNVAQNSTLTQTVKTIQYLLQFRGYTTVTADGAFGPGTDAAVKNFQTSKGLSADGVVGAGTWTALIAVTQQGETSAKAKAVQSELGITVDGIFGSGTATAVRNFQTSKGLTANGIVEETTWNALVK